MKIQFYAASKPLPDHLADVQLIFEEAGLRGLSLSGIALWKRQDGERGIVVTLPRRTYEREGGQPAGHYNYIRGDRAAVEKLKGEIVAEFVRRHPQVGRALVAPRSSRHGAQEPR